MEELLKNIDWIQVLSIVWTVILLPILNFVRIQFQNYMKSKNLEKYSSLLLNSTDRVVKELYNTVVDDIKGTEEWTKERQEEIFDMAKKKVVISLTTEGYTFLQAVNEDFDTYIDTCIESKIYDLKHSK